MPLFTRFVLSSSYEFRVRAFGCNVHVATKCRETYSILERYVFPSLPRRVGDSDHPDIVLRVNRLADQFQLLVDDAVIASASHAISLVPDLIRALDEAVIQRLTTFYAVHAGAVVWNERALLLPGITHAGKSSLVAELLRRGATYFSDEYALIDARGRAHPYPRPLLLRHGCPQQVPVLASECDALTGEAPVPVGWILSLAYSPHTTWSIAAVPQSTALLTLLQNTPHVLAESPGMVGTFERAVAGAACYYGYRGEAVDAVDHILQVVDTPMTIPPGSQDNLRLNMPSQLYQ